MILNRDAEINALRSCGLDFHADYQQLAPARETIGLEVWIPKAERPAQPAG